MTSSPKSEHGFIETAIHGGLSLWNLWDQGKALFAGGTLEEKQATNKHAAIAFAAKTLEEYVSGRIDGKTAIAKGIDDFADYKITNYLESKGVSSVFAKGIGLFASNMIEKMVKGAEDHFIPDRQNLDRGTQQLYASGQINPDKPDQGLIQRFIRQAAGLPSPETAETVVPPGGARSPDLSALAGMLAGVRG